MIGLAAIESARSRLIGHILATPLVSSPSLSEMCGVPVGLKLEHHQITGSFKLRGATNAVGRLTKAQRTRGVVAASTGNHGRALSYAARCGGSHATICMSRLVPQNKIFEIRRLGAEVRIVGGSQDEAQREVDRLVDEKGLIILPPFDHPDIVAGQGTIGLEIVEAMPEVATVLVPLSGGGLAAGIAAAVKCMRPRARVLGITMERGAAMKASLDAGRPVQLEEFPSLADSLGGGIGLDNRVTFAMCRALLDDVLLLSEPEIAVGIRHAYENEREILEGAGAAGIAALLAGKVTGLQGPVTLVLSGRNIDMELHRRVVNGESDPFGRRYGGKIEAFDTTQTQKDGAART
jgi:threonine dehydratase